MEALFLKLSAIQMQPGWGIIFASVIVPLLVFCRSIPGKIYERLRMMLTIALTIDETDNMAGTKTFQSLNSWLCEHRVGWLTRIFEVNGNREIVAGVGFNVFYFKGSLFWCVMGRKDPTSNFSKIKAIGTYVIYTFKWNKHLLNEFVEEACKPTTTDFKGKIYRGCAGEVNYVSDFPLYMKNQKQLIASYTYDQMTEIFEKFLNEDDYVKRQRPHKETILLYGPPGTGKTNLASHLAAKYNMDLVTLSPDQITLTSFSTKSWEARYFKGNTIFLVEDIDSNKAFLTGHVQEDKIVVNTGEDSSSASKGTLSDMLNALDGAVPLNHCIVILSTNYPQKIQESIYRDGRVDHHILMDYISYRGALKYLGWKDGDELSQALKLHGPKEFPAALISRLNFAKTEEEVITVIKGGDITKTLKNYSK